MFLLKRSCHVVYSEEACFNQMQYCVGSLVFSQSLISLDLIEDFLELAGRAKEEGKPSPYKGKRLISKNLYILNKPSVKYGDMAPWSYAEFAVYAVFEF